MISFVKKLSLLVALFLSLGRSNTTYAAASQFNLDFGLDTPDASEVRSGNATLIKFALANNKKSWWRWVGAFAIAWGSLFKQGEFLFGPHIYPLVGVSKSKVQPFLYAEGVWGLGSFNNASRTEAGFAMGVGADIFIKKRWGFTIAFEQHNATETATRIWIGIFNQ